MLLRVPWTFIKIVKLGELNELAYEDLMLFINNNFSKNCGKKGYRILWIESKKKKRESRKDGSENR